MSRGRIAPALAVLLGIIVLGVAMSTVVLDALVHTPATGGPVVESPSLCWWVSTRGWCC